MENGQTPLAEADVEAMVRRYLGKIARRYSPVAMAAVAFALIITLVPTVNRKDGAATSAFGTSPGGAQAGEPGGGGDAGGAAAQGAAPGPDGTTITAPGAAGSGSAAAARRGTSAGVAGSGGGGVSPAVATGPTGAAGGTARSGVTCGKGALQVTWTPYAPPCTPLFTGDNGGNTSFGVTKDTITVAFRRTNSAEEKAAFAAMGSAAPGTDDQYLSDFRTYVDFFNKTYELYGRKVVVKDYSGQGDNLQEDQGQNLEGAQADASTVKDMGAFMDMSQSPTLASTQPYEEALAHEKVIAIGGLGLPKSWFKQYAPYEYSLVPTGTTGALAAAAALCARAWDMPAVFAGDAVYQGQKRKFGLITPDNPSYMEIGDQIQAYFRDRCGGKVDKRVSYAINVSTMAQQSISVVAQMRQAGITTVICACDPVVEVAISQAADGQRYYPEWFVTAFGDPQARQMSQNEWSHAIAGGGQTLPRAQDEAYKVFKLANPKGEPAEQYFSVAYWQVAYVFNLLQRAGPDLNPLTFQKAAFTMPTTARGQIGVLGGGDEAYSPAKEGQVGYWDPNAASNFDGQKGAWLNCEGGKWFQFDDPSVWGQRQQFHCFGK